MTALPLKIGEYNGKMFGWIDKKWNPVTGCYHGCQCCWAKKLAKSRLKNIERYRHGFIPTFNRKELPKKFSNKTVFVSDMGDLFGDWVKNKWIAQVLKSIENSPTSEFLLLTKNPKRFKDFLELFPENVILGATIETNRNYTTPNSKKYKPQTRFHRYVSMKSLRWHKKFLAIEPLMDFDAKIFEKWICEIRPEKVSISLDNWNKGLSSPKIEDVLDFCENLSDFTLVLPHGDWTKDEKVRMRLRRIERINRKDKNTRAQKA